MTDFKAGDKIRVKTDENTDPRPNWTVTFVGNDLAILRPGDNNWARREISRSLDNLGLHWELVPETFEAGKRYRSKSIHDTAPDFTVLYADEEIAFARYYATGKHSAHVHLYQSTRNTHEEA